MYFSVFYVFNLITFDLTTNTLKHKKYHIILLYFLRFKVFYLFYLITFDLTTNTLKHKKYRIILLYFIYFI
jgi:hypothetical protein